MGNYIGNFSCLFCGMLLDVFLNQLKVRILRYNLENRTGDFFRRLHAYGVLLNNL